MTVYSERRKKLLSLAKGEQVMALSAANLFYVTDFFGGGAGIVLPDKTVVVTSALEADRAEEKCKEAEIIVVTSWKDASKAVRKLTKGKGVTDAFEPRALTFNFKIRPELFVEVRRAKDEMELERIRKACAKTDKVYEGLVSAMKPGRTEWQVAAEAMKIATEQGMSPLNSDSILGPIIVASGPHGAYGHSELSNRRLQNGDFVVADLGFRFEGYHSDETRTFAIGSVSSEMRRHYAAVKDAQAAALGVAKEGARCGDVHGAAVDVLKKYGMDKLLNHGVGHGVGIDIHELPDISNGNKVKLLRYDVITDEPGVYLPGKFGVRIEDTLVVGKRPEVLTKFTKDLLTVG